MALSAVRQLTDVKRRVLGFGEVVNVGDAEGCDGGLSNASQGIPQEHIDPHVRAGVFHTVWRHTHTHIPYSYKYWTQYAETGDAGVDNMTLPVLLSEDGSISISGTTEACLMG